MFCLYKPVRNKSNPSSINFKKKKIDIFCKALQSKLERSSQDTSHSSQFVFDSSQLQEFTASIKTNLISGWTSPFR